VLAVVGAVAVASAVTNLHPLLLIAGGAAAGAASSLL
jgi:hypothetical protein